MEPVIELEIEGVLVDLHNFAEFRGFRWNVPDGLVVLGRFDAAYANRMELPHRLFTLTFSSVRQLHVEQSDPYDVRNGPDIEGWVVLARNEAGRDVLELEAGGLVLRFQTVGVEFAWAEG